MTYNIDRSRYSIVDLQVINRHRPRYYVCNDLQLLARPEPGAYIPREDDDMVQDAAGNPIKLGGIVRVFRVFFARFCMFLSPVCVLWSCVFWLSLMFVGFWHRYLRGRLSGR